MNVKDESYLIVLFDDDCNLCSSSIQFIINRDNSDIFRFASIQSEVGARLLNMYHVDIQINDSIILITNKNVKYRSSAVLHILFYLKTIWKIFLLFYIIPRPIRDVVYNIIAKNRYSLFGKKRKCMLPNPSLSSKFLSL